jgi:hypothetical protein
MPVRVGLLSDSLTTTLPMSSAAISDDETRSSLAVLGTKLSHIARNVSPDVEQCALIALFNDVTRFAALRLR